MKTGKRYNTASYKHLEAILIKEGGVLGVVNTKEEAIELRKDYYTLRTWILENNDFEREFLHNQLCDMTTEIVESYNDIGEKQYMVELIVSPLAQAARRATGEIPEASFARRYRYAKQWGLEHLLAETQP